MYCPALRLWSGLLVAGLALTALNGCFTSNERSGAALYAEHCANCHGPQGDGLGLLIPPLAGADYLTTHRSALPCIVRHGLRGPLTINGKGYDGVMPGFGREKLSDADVANVLNYIRTSWGNRAPDTFTVPDVTDAHCSQ